MSGEKSVKISRDVFNKYCQIEHELKEALFHCKAKDTVISMHYAAVVIADAKIKELESRLTALESKLRKSEERCEKLKHYTEHSYNCKISLIEKCICGLDTLLNEQAKGE